jgi:hypothetical protein
MDFSLLIGNSDNKLTQQEWAAYVNDIQTYLKSIPTLQLHFEGFSPSQSQYQNACWVGEVKGSYAPDLGDLKNILNKYRQESIALLYGRTSFIWGNSNHTDERFNK